MADTSTGPAAAAGGTAEVADTARWAIDANSLTSLDQQESKGDEVYVASIAFRSTPGAKDSTRTWFRGGLRDLDGVHKGETHPIPDSMGRVTFEGVSRVTAADVGAGRLPELIGTLTIVFESDRSPDNAIDSLLTGAAADLRPEVAGIVEPLSLTGDLNAQLAGMGDKIKDAVAPSVLEKVTLLVFSLFNPDDLIGGLVNVFAAVDDQLAAPVDDLLGRAIAPSLGVGGALRARTYSQTFTGKGAQYRLDFAVGKS